MGIDNLAVDRRYDVVLRNNDSLSGHGRRFILGRTGLHNLLQMRRQIDKRTTHSKLSFVSVDLQLHVANSALRETGILVLRT